MLLVGAGVMGYETGLWVSFGLAVAILGLWGLLVGRHRDRGTAYTVKLVSISVVLGLVLVALKEFVH